MGYINIYTYIILKKILFDFYKYKIYIYRRANGIYIPKSCNLQLMKSLSLFFYMAYNKRLYLIVPFNLLRKAKLKNRHQFFKWKKVPCPPCFYPSLCLSFFFPFTSFSQGCGFGSTLTRILFDVSRIRNPACLQGGFRWIREGINRDLLRGKGMRQCTQGVLVNVQWDSRVYFRGWIVKEGAKNWNWLNHLDGR